MLNGEEEQQTRELGEEKEEREAEEGEREGGGGTRVQQSVNLLNQTPILRSGPAWETPSIAENSPPNKQTLPSRRPGAF